VEAEITFKKDGSFKMVEPKWVHLARISHEEYIWLVRNAG
jgi:hypothetical protein